MKPEQLKHALDTITPSEAQKERMLSNMTEPGAANAAAKRGLPFRRIVSIAAAAAVLILAGAGGYRLLAGDVFPQPELQTDAPGAASGQFVADAGADDKSGDGREIAEPATARIYYFKWQGRVYYPLHKDMAEDFGLRLTPAPAEIGEKVTDITGSADPTLVGGSVYRYLPAGSEAVVAVKVGGNYTLYRFINFEKYEKNADEDAAVYLRLYGINSAADIAKIQLIRYSEAAKLENKTDVATVISDAAGIAKFYGYYSVLKDSSAAYFDKLYSYRENGTGEKSTASNKPTAPDAPTVPHASGSIEMTPPARGEIMPYEATVTAAPAQDTPVYDMPAQNASTVISSPQQSAGATQGSAGSAGNALADSVAIRIFNRSGLYYDAVYYPHMGFISRHQIGADFAGFLAGYLG